MKKEIPINTNSTEYWRSLEQLAETTRYKDFLHREFPEGASEMDNRWSRRSFLTLMGASIALAGLAGCRRPIEKIIPYVTRPEEVVPGNPLTFATTMPFGLHSYGVLARSNEGRPTKLDGNPEHPATLGGASIYMQAAVLDLYDPDRLQAPIEKRAERTWDDFVSFWREKHPAFVESKGEGLAVLSGAFASPTMARLKKEFLKTFPKATWATYESVSDENARGGMQIATGKEYLPVYHLEQADTIMSLDCDFIGREGNTITNAKGFADGRRVYAKNDTMNRLYVVESCYTSTGAMADHRLRVRASRVGAFTVALARELVSQGLSLTDLSKISGNTDSFDKKWVREAARDLIKSGGRSLVMVGDRQPVWVHALVLAINTALGSVGSAVEYYEPQDMSTPSRNQLMSLTRAMSDGKVDTLLMLGGNPSYDAPADFRFGSALKKVATSIHLTHNANETSAACTWLLPRAHFLESWGDASAVDGTLSVVQPLIEPLYGAHSDVEVLALIAGGVDGRGYEIVRETWKDYVRGDFEAAWRRVLHDGLLKGSANKAIRPSIRRGDLAAGLELISLPSATVDGLEIEFAPSNVWDGRWANNGWLQELPDAMSKLAWDNAALMSAATAKKLGVDNESMIQLTRKSVSIETVVWISPGHADDSITLLLGYGRQAAGRVGNGVGFDVSPLRTSEAIAFGSGAGVVSLERSYELANTQDHGSMEGRPIVREASLAEYQATDEPIFKPEKPPHPALTPMWDPHTYETGYQWGMSIDLNTCVGCNACAVACQSENNIAIVGKEQVRNGREMHWIRLDRYYAGDVAEPQVALQPVACQHCEMAPCEQVCPVAATVHDSEGLNTMVYNRCVGTRYCSNNCPYKVRRFNFFNYTNEYPEVQKMVQNPDVTVRSRGVMEKCTYCVQRIAGAKIVSKRENRAISDGEIQTACQQACPSKAIVFGNINDPDSQVSRMKKVNRDYRLLEELFTAPRTSFLAKLRNPNPALEQPAVTGGSAH